MPKWDFETELPPDSGLTFGDWTPVDVLEAGGGSYPPTPLRGLVRATNNQPLNLGPLAAIHAQLASRDLATLRAAATLGAAALDLAAGTWRGLQDLRERGLQTGRVYVPRKWVIEGLAVSLGQERSLSIAAGRAFWGGREWILPQRQNAVGIPPNPLAYDRVFTLYLDAQGNPYLTEGNAPERTLPLARVQIPAGDVAPTFGGSLTDLRQFGPRPSPWLPAVATRYTVSLPYPMPDTRYAVFVSLLEATDLGDVGVEVVERTRNTFTLRVWGYADDVVLRWVAVEPSWR